MNRRHFLRTLALTSGLAIPFGRQAWAYSTSGSGNDQPHGRTPRLVVIMLRGAVDGLSIVAPHGDPDYARARPNIALAPPGAEDGLLDLDGHFGLHPALSPLFPLWQQGKLAFVHASGSPDPTRSHFDAQDYLESGTPGRKSTPDGWLNRLAALLPGEPSPMRAIGLGPVLPRILSGSAPATNLAFAAGKNKPELLDRPAVATAFDQLYRRDDRLGRAYAEGRETRKEILAAGSEQEMRMADNGAPLPNGFPAEAAHLARLMRGNDSIRLAFVALGGWDTHANQGKARGQLANRLAPLGQGLAELASRLGPLFDDTAIVVMSEFGRTVRENGNGGTDHGHGNVMWLLGGSLAGGRVLGEWPGLHPSRLYEGRDLAVTTDYRNVLGEVLRSHLRVQETAAANVFPGAPGGSNALRGMFRA
ncbi:DUF1501 domain-containing protein [Noviherbaspirillum galbum]|uniref:DUF1501 domain-containing protein n=1 Tax=Noviherbaspirillum galbum TaxID=2709383 RepID=A0A6B3SJY1_9BURK|nr:DUF1501 domain-containing protein [Noviherbaspirillum galbum]NEX61063.1 DUF1501 domain-containing protein [Noviherbaspirillum galbum]